MPQTQVVIYREEDGTMPLLQWLDDLPDRAQDKCRIRIERLADLGNELRRPEADFLQDGIYELRVRLHSINYRILYFFAGRSLAVLSHGLTKEKKVPAKEIQRAVEHKKKFVNNPDKHSYRE